MKENTSYSNSKAEAIIHGSNSDNMFESIYKMIMTKIQKFQLIKIMDYWFSNRAKH